MSQSYIIESLTMIELLTPFLPRKEFSLGPFQAVLQELLDRHVQLLLGCQSAKTVPCPSSLNVQPMEQDETDKAFVRFGVDKAFATMGPPKTRHFGGGYSH